jgi:hypothetical protein
MRSPTIDGGQLLVPGTRGDLKFSLIPFAEPSVETDKAGQIGIYRAPSQFAIFQKIEKIVLNLLIAQRVRGLHVKFG